MEGEFRWGKKRERRFKGGYGAERNGRSGTEVEVAVEGEGRGGSGGS